MLSINTSPSYAVITGGGTGIGHSLATWLAENGHKVFIIGRHIKPLKCTRKLFSNQIEIIQADISNPTGRLKIFNMMRKNAKISCLVHNAAIIESSELKNITLKSWQSQISTNVEGPLFLTQLLLPFLKNGGRVLHISSKLAHEPCHGIGAHCISKAALYMLYNCLKLELKKFDISVGSLRPGAVDTLTQKKVRSFPQATFPSLPIFKALKKDKKLQDPLNVARFIEWVLFNTTDKKFSETEWNIYDNWHHKNWLTDAAPIDNIDLEATHKNF